MSLLQYVHKRIESQERLIPGRDSIFVIMLPRFELFMEYDCTMPLSFVPK